MTHRDGRDGGRAWWWHCFGAEEFAHIEGTTMGGVLRGRRDGRDGGRAPWRHCSGAEEFADIEGTAMTIIGRSRRRKEVKTVTVVVDGGNRRPWRRL